MLCVVSRFRNPETAILKGPMEEGKRNKGGRPKGKAPRLQEFSLAPADFAYLQAVANRTDSSPERVARGLIHAAIWRAPESLALETERLALEEAALLASATDSPEDEEPA
jgi:hypothetical protein